MAMASPSSKLTRFSTALPTPAFVARVSTHTTKEIIRAKSVIKQAFNYQKDNTCFTFVEVLSICPTNWGLSPRESEKWLEQEMLPYYPLGIVKRPEDFEEIQDGGH